eukprot:gnl/Hemi2/1931_TR687_c1_g1_i2.p1 gnl/Hemi2/1931_TR687_c1_g1~~gnl/Hemi2/1931_TR687_c1_g1_i2.p1  ORF type:complete len:1247 (-),score=148.47 gnl/Hemi2/1931_TR687_c1_g1_i2:385-4125(-)
MQDGVIRQLFDQESEFLEGLSNDLSRVPTEMVQQLAGQDMMPADVDAIKDLCSSCFEPGSGHVTAVLRLLHALLDAKPTVPPWTLLTDALPHLCAFPVLLRALVAKGKWEAACCYVCLLTSAATLAATSTTANAFFDPLLFREIMNLLKRWGSSGNVKERRNSMQVDGEEDEDATPDNPDGPFNLLSELLTLFKTIFIFWSRGSSQTLGLLVREDSLAHSVDVLMDLSRSLSAPNGVWDACFKLLDALLQLSHIPRPVANRKSLPGPGRRRQTERQSLPAEPGADPSSSSETIRQILKKLLPSLLMTHCALSKGAPQKNVLSIRKRALQFLKEVCTGHVQAGPHIGALLQHMCVQVPDRTEYRDKAAQAIVLILKDCPAEQRERFVSFVALYSKNAKGGFRLFATDMVFQLLANFPTDSALVEILVRRCSDVSPTVRARALTNLATALSTPDLQEVFRGVFRADTTEPEAPQASGLRKMLRRRAMDEKPVVRKAALKVYEYLYSLPGSNLADCLPDLTVFRDCAQDTGLVIRKQAITAVTSLLAAHPTAPAIQSAWLSAVLPLVMDAESTVVDRCLATVSDMILLPIAEKRDASVRGLLQQMDSELSNYLQRVVLILARQRKLPCGLAAALQKIVAADAPPAPISFFLLLEEVAVHCHEQLDAEAIVHCARSLDSTRTTSPDNEKRLVHMLHVLGSVASHIPCDVGARLSSELLAALVDFRYPPSLIQVSIRALLALSRRDRPQTTATLAAPPAATKRKKAPPAKKARKNVVADAEAAAEQSAMVTDSVPHSTQLDHECSTEVFDFADQLAQACDAFFAPLVYGPPPPQPFDFSALSTRVVSHLFTLGECACLLPSHRIPSRAVTAIQALVAPTLHIGGGESESKADDAAVPVVVRAHAFLALGKLCLENHVLAKKCMGLFAREMLESDVPIVRNNILVIMSDLCKRYTALVDPYMSRLAMCLRDRNEVVRRHALVLLTNLLQEEYIKWKGGLLFRFLVTLSDDSDDVRKFAQYCLFSVLQTHSPGSFFTHFVESVFVLNGYTQHPHFNQFPQADRFAMEGGEFQRKRLRIYRLMLETFTDEQKFNTAGKLCSDVLGAVVEGTVSLEDGSAVIADTLAILASKEIKLHKGGGPGDDDDAAETGEGPGAEKLNAARGKLLTQLLKKSTMDIIVPIIIELKHHMERVHSPLLRNLMHYLRELTRDFKTEIQEILSADKQLSKEIEFDLRQFDQQQQQQQLLRRFPTPL